MSVAELRLEVIRRAAATTSELALRQALQTLPGVGLPPKQQATSAATSPTSAYGIAPEPDPRRIEEPAYDGEADPEAVLGYRPDGAEVRLGEARAQWGNALDGFLEGRNTQPAEEVFAEMRAYLPEARSRKEFQ